MPWPSRSYALFSTASDPCCRARVRCLGPHCRRAQLFRCRRSSPLPPPPKTSSYSEPPFSVVYPCPCDPSPEPAAEPWSTLCARSTLPLLAVPLYTKPCSASMPRSHTWSVLVVVLASGPELDLVRQSWRIHALLGLEVLILRTHLQLHSLPWPQQPYLRSLRDSGDIRPGWDSGPLLRYLRDYARRPDPLSGPRHQGRGSPRDLGLSRHLPQLMRNYHPIFH